MFVQALLSHSRNTTPLQVCGSSGSTVSHPKTHAVSLRTCCHTQSFITHPNTPCGCSDALSHPLVYHTPLGAPASCILSPGVHKIPPPPQDTTPGDNISKAQNVITGVCYLVSYTVCCCIIRYRYFEVHTHMNAITTYFLLYIILLIQQQYVQRQNNDKNCTVCQRSHAVAVVARTAVHEIATDTDVHIFYTYILLYYTLYFVYNMTAVPQHFLPFQPRVTPCYL